MNAGDSQDYCAAQVREYDYARYFAAAFAPPEIRRSLLALYAFNLEIASTRERVSEALLGEMRLQWWRDTVETIYAGTIRKNAVVEELAAAIDAHALPRAALDALIDARSFDLADEPPADMMALEAYATATAGGLAGLAGQICGATDTVLERAGTAWGLAGTLRAAPFHAAAGRVYLPRDGFGGGEPTPEEIASAAKSGAFRVAAAPVAARAAELLVEVRAAALQRPARPAIAYLGVAGLYLDRLDSRRGDLFAPGLEPGHLAVQWRTARAVWFGRF